MNTQKLNRNLLLIYLVLCAFFEQNIGYAQIEPVLRNYTVEDGLPSSQVYQIKQDSKGFIWFSTDFGVSRFDGNQFENFTPSNGLCVKTLFGIYEDDQERIWFYSYSGELIYFDYKDQKIHCPSFNSKLKELVKGKVLNGLFIEKDTIYTYDYAGVLYKVDLSGNQVFKEINDRGFFLDYSYNNLISGVRINEKKDKTLLFSIHGKQNGFKKLDEFFLDFQRNSIKSMITSSFIGQSDELFCSLNNLIVCFNKKDGTFKSKKIKTAITNSLFQSKDKLLWIGTYLDGVYAFNVQDKIIQKYHFLQGKVITSVLEDRHGGFWFSTLSEGVYYASSLDISILSSNNVIDIVTNNENLIFQTNDLNLYSLNFDFIDSIRKVGINFLNTKIYTINQEFHVFNGTSYNTLEGKNSIIEDNRTIDIKVNKGYYLSLEKIDYGNFSLNKIVKNKIKSTYNAAIDITIRNDALITENGNFYLGNNSELVFHDTLTKETTYISQKYESNFHVSSMALLKGDSAWISTKDKGLLLVHKNKILKVINSENWLPTNNCNHVLIDNNNLIVSTNRGVYKLNNPYGSISIEKMDKNSGLPNNEIIKTLRVKNNLYVASNKGLCYFDTLVFSKVHVLPRCEIISHSINLLDSNKLTLNHNFDKLSISYYAINFQNAFKIPYRYRLNKKQTWIYTNKTEVIFTSLSPDNYTFEVQAANSKGEWGESAILNFTVLLPFWQRPFYILVFVFLIGLIAYLIYTNRINNIKRINKLKTSLLINQNKAMSSQMNPHFIFNSLNSISNTLMKNDLKSSVLYLGKFGKLMRTVFENSQETFITLGEELDALKAYLEVEKIRLKNKLNYRISIDSEINKDQCFVPALLLQPFIENAIWHGIAPKEGNGFITINISIEIDNLAIQIIDNGVGIKEPISIDSPTIKSGMSTTIKRIQLIKDIYKKNIYFEIKPVIESNVIAGTKVLITIPILKTKRGTI